MQWIALSLLSAVCLGVYGLAKKTAVDGNAVPPVLLLNVATAALIYLPVMMLSRFEPTLVAGSGFYVDSLSWRQHGLLFAKSALVGMSWTLAFYGLKHLPLSIATPIRSTSPLWTIVVAVASFGERPTVTQWLGIAVIVAAFLAFSMIGRREGIEFRRNRWVGMMVAATLLGSLSALYDKYLLQTQKFSPSTVQAWFSVYLVVVMLPLCLHWYLRARAVKPFQFRWSIPAIAVTLLVADFLYFTAIADHDAMVAVISPLRRTSVVIPFLYGVIQLKEKNGRSKGACIAVMLAGVYLIRLG